MMGLTPRQSDCLAYVRSRLEEGEVAPSLDEIAAYLGVVKSSVHRMVSALVERGHLVRLQNRSRGLALAPDAISSRQEAGLALLSRVTGKRRDQLVAQAVEEFLERQVRS
ncbi:MAG: MarR family transcriptional regulator [Bosea sp.]|uniref:LexA family protein n=1 Tax=Bosea sp. (in: a-proteobacteria) TaxID=1871050 RepID=UPI0023922099|nr:MarR family transcriptional regulator [Bosea sp. (in: a-proteobacteria)]MCP4734246.1 MarR family transcriptional regulator [Bosea sp. (in: a-proteobacteria)]